MGRIILTLAAPWSKAPAFDTPLHLDYGPPVPALVDEFGDLGRRAGTVGKGDLVTLRGHQGVLTATAEFDAPGDLTHARAGARLALDAVAQGALGLYVETAMKVLMPASLEGLDPTDATSLFHLFVEVMGDAGHILTEGMQAFDLPDVIVHYAGREQVAAAQGTAFGLAARMVCDRYRPVADGSFRNSESAPRYLMSLEPPPADAEPDDPFVNARGSVVLTPAP